MCNVCRGLGSFVPTEAASELIEVFKKQIAAELETLAHGTRPNAKPQGIVSATPENMKGTKRRVRQPKGLWTRWD